MSIEELVSMLESLNDMNLPDQGDETITQPEELIHSIVSCADVALIDNDGHNIWENIEILRDHGFSVFAGEQDRFGWLSGCIQTKKGIIVYG